MAAGRPGLDVAAPEVAEVLAGLKAAQAEFGKELRREHKLIAERVAARIAQRASSTRGYRSFAQAWRPSGVRNGARLTLRRQAGATTRYLGTRPLTRTGWNAAVYRNGARLKGRRYVPPDRRQAPEWVGNNWIVGLRGEGPHIVRDIAPQMVDEVTEQLADAFERATTKVWKG